MRKTIKKEILNYPGKPEVEFEIVEMTCAYVVESMNNTIAIDFVLSVVTVKCWV